MQRSGSTVLDSRPPKHEPELGHRALVKSPGCNTISIFSRRAHAKRRPFGSKAPLPRFRLPLHGKIGSARLRPHMSAGWNPSA